MRAELGPWTARGIGLAAGALLVWAIVNLAAAAAGALLLVFLAILLASALEPIVAWLRSRLPIGRGAAILLVYAGFFGTVLALGLLVAPAAVGQLNSTLTNLPPLVERAQAWAETLRPPALATSVSALITAANAALHPPPPRPNEVVEVGLTVAEAAVAIASILTLVYFWLVEHARLQRYALAFLPAPRRAGARDAWNAIESRLGLWMRGQLTLMAAVGLATGIAYTLLGVPSPLVLALIAAVTEAIPIVGPLLGAIPAVLVAASVSPQLALAVAAVYVLVQLVEGNVLVPLVMRNTIGISPFLVLVSLLVGAAVGGFVGALLAVPVVATIEVVLDRLQARHVPVAQDPAAAEAVSPDAAAEHEASLPDAGTEGRRATRRA